MSALTDVEDTRPDILIETQAVKDEISFTWKIADFSQIWKKLKFSKAQFSLTGNSTTWMLKLNETNIELSRTDTGETVYCDIEASLETINKTYEKKGSDRFYSNLTRYVLLSFDCDFDKWGNAKRKTLEFKDDVFKLSCKMKIFGPATTRIIRSADYLKPNFEKLIDDFKSMLNNKQCCDVTISVGNEKLSVHKAVLCARSKVLSRMLQDDMQENKNNVIELDDLDFDTVKDFVKFLYTGKLDIVTIEKAKNLYSVANKFDVTDLCEKCTLYLQVNLSIDEACSVLRLAELHRDDKLKNAAAFFIQMHVTDVKSTDGWKDLVKQQPKLAFQILK